MSWIVYIVRCSDGSLYTGYTADLEKRLSAHNEGKGAKYTAGRRPVILVYREVFSDRRTAMQREYQIKRWPRAKKEVLLSSPH
ncbi:MAG TPA: GIY-YIG nuclease family protein [Thermoanaerobaculia bacterium]|nr:GIY-YIG nuclease family protein [Thermoanaerobaculia bacterium]HUM29420.1 GIY-YIG nuclease family protein [Thermoanaerobaculia bacterium]HXK67666.1 GIY-YIG nuclease family protein [Thermoanaerobaculia bacterium]